MKLEEARAQVEQAEKEDKLRVEFLLSKGDFSEDGYPTDDALEIIEKWHWIDSEGWFKFIKDIWYLSSWGWHEGTILDEWSDTEMYQYNISTAGWSGNESIIAAMQRNWMMWNITWVQSRRGGHYIFEKKTFDGDV